MSHAVREFQNPTTSEVSRPPFFCPQKFSVAANPWGSCRAQGDDAGGDGGSFFVHGRQSLLNVWKTLRLSKSMLC
jgi:hypothetical protein